MMLFWLKKKKVVLDCFTHINYAHNILPIEKATRYMPDWFKTLKPSNLSNPYEPPLITMKACPGFINYFAHSFVIPAWDHIHMRVSRENLQVLCETIKHDAHSPEQYGEFLDQSYIHFKINTPWFINSKSNVKFMQTFPVWCYQGRHRPEKILHCPGILDFHTQSSTNVNMFVKKPVDNEKDYIITFEPGLPLVFYTPLEDVEVKINNHLISVAEYDQKKNRLGLTPAPNRYNTYRKLIEKRDAARKCPFGFK